MATRRPFLAPPVDYPFRGSSLLGRRPTEAPMGAGQPISTTPARRRRADRAMTLLRAGTQRLSGESGVALAMAVGILLVLTITATSVLRYTSSAKHGANLSSSGEKSFTLAEAGVNSALSILAKSGTTRPQSGRSPATQAIRPRPSRATRAETRRRGAEPTTRRTGPGRSSRSEAPGTLPGRPRRPSRARSGRPQSSRLHRTASSHSTRRATSTRS